MLHRLRGRLPYYGWILMVVLGITTIISYGTTVYLFGVLIVPIGADLHGDRASLSAAFSCGLLLAGLLGLPIGRLVDRWGARLIMSIGSAWAGISLIGLASAQTIVQFILWWVLGVGVSTAFTFYPVSFTVATNWFDKKRGTALAVLTLLGGLASPLFIPGEGWMIQHINWRMMLILLGLLHLLIALPLHAILLRRRPEDHGFSRDGVPSVQNTESGVLSGLHLQEAVRTPVFWLLLVSLSLAMLGNNVIQVHQISALLLRGYDPVLAATLVGGLGLSSILGRVILNLLSERVRPQTLLWINMVAQAVGMAMLILAPSPGWLLVYVLIYGAAYGAISPLYASVLAGHVGRRAYGSIFALQGIAVAFCGGLGPLAAGWLFDALHNYTLAFWITAGIFLLGALGIFLTPHAVPFSEKIQSITLAQTEDLASRQ